MSFSSQLVLVTLFAVINSLGAAAADFTKTFQGTITYNSTDGTQSFADQLVFTTHTDSSGHFIPDFETTETVAGDTGQSIFRNPVALADGSGYTFDMSGTLDGQPVGDLGQCFVAYGSPGNFTSFSFNKCNVPNDDGVYQTGSGTFNTSSDGHVTFTRNESVVDGSGNVLQTITATQAQVDGLR